VGEQAGDGPATQRPVAQLVESVSTSGADCGRTALSKFGYGHLSHFKEDTGEPSVPVQE